MANNFFKLKNNCDLTITFCSFGASVYSLKFGDDEMLLSPLNDFDFCYSDEYYGKTIGRVAGRIKSHQLIAGNPVTLSGAEHDITLHGGKQNLSFVDYKYRVTADEEHYYVEFKYLSPIGEANFNSNLDVKITYVVWKNANMFKIIFEGLSDKDSLLNLTNHMYFNFNTTDLLDYELEIPAVGYLGMNNYQLPINHQSLPSYLDFNEPKTFSKDLKDINANFPYTIDHTFILDKSKDYALKLRNNKYELVVKTTYECLNCYLTSSAQPILYSNNLVAKKNKGFAIEPVHDNLNNINVKANELYHEEAIYEFTKL